MSATATLRSFFKQTRTWAYFLWQIVQDFWENLSGPLITFPNHHCTVRRGRELAQGGFSIVWEAHAVQRNNSNALNTNRTYALKQCNVTDREYLRACQAEAAVHEALHHPNCMPLLGMTIVSSHSNQKTCFMLFPFFTKSLRDHVNESLFSHSNSAINQWTEEILLQVFHGILQGVQAMHQAQYTHRDLKLENVLLDISQKSNRITPILMDFGSAGPLYAPASTRSDLLHITDQAAQHTTITYRPPELLEGTLWPCEAHTRTLDYQKVDVWSCACILFAMMYGASPVEWQNGKVVECTPLSILNARITVTNHHSPYSTELHQLIASTLVQEPDQRPDLTKLIQQVESLLVQKQGTVPRTNPSDCWWYSLNEHVYDTAEDKDDVSLLRSRV
jgi:serine/threonine kinase 16